MQRLDRKSKSHRQNLFFNVLRVSESVQELVKATRQLSRVEGIPLLYVRNLELVFISRLLKAAMCLRTIEQR